MTNEPDYAKELARVNQQLATMAREQQQAIARRTAAVDPSTYAGQYQQMIQPPGDLERVDVARPEEIAEMVRLRREGMQGLTAPQYAVARQQMMSQQGAAEQMAQRQLARQQSIAGVRGGAAAKQSSRLAQQLAQQRAQQEQGLFMADVAEKQKGMGAYEQTLGGAVQGEQARRLFNIEQQQREQMAQQARELTVAQLSQASALGERQAQAGEYYANQMARAGGGGKVICTELYRQGLMDIDTFEADQKFGAMMRVFDPVMMIGYWAWARPVVSLMKRSSIVTAIVSFIAKPWAKEMAFRVGARTSGSKVGRFLMTLGIPFCRAVGTVAVKRKYGTT